mmetsp:Transcript_111176/g.310592  ORF Transcript_111176/g.310592 Transcript_111176/m.310592 type:complete len:195 (+) Transcript_111176:78-662(+)
MGPHEACPTLLHHSASPEARTPWDGKCAGEVRRSGFIKARRAAAAPPSYRKGNADIGRRVQRMAHVAMLTIMGLTAGTLLVVGLWLFIAADGQPPPVDVAECGGANIAAPGHEQPRGHSGSGTAAAEAARSLAAAPAAAAAFVESENGSQGARVNSSGRGSPPYKTDGGCDYEAYDAKLKAYDGPLDMGAKILE